MKRLHLAELRELLHGTAFAAWWSEWQRAAAAEAEARAREEDAAAQGGLQLVRAQLAERAGTEARARLSALGSEADRLESEAQGRDRLERSLLAAEKRAEARRARAEADRRAAEAEERRARARALESEARAARTEREDQSSHRRRLLGEAAEALGCIPGEIFLYWPQSEEPDRAWAVALAEGASPEVKPLTVWTVDPRRGADALSPPREGAAARPLPESPKP